MCGSDRQECGREDSDRVACGCSEQRAPRLLQPFILLVLKGKDAYGYELIEKISEFQFHNSPPDVGAIYRSLRSMEKEGWVKSKWDTKGTGPAKRIYRSRRKERKSCTGGLSLSARGKRHLASF